MRVQHLIDGKAVAGRDYFETVDPATQDVLAEVAAGTAAEVNAGGGRRQGGLPGLGRTSGHRARRADAQARRPDHATRARVVRDRDPRLRPGDLADAQEPGAPRGRQLPLLRRDVHPRRRPHLPDADAPELHAVPPGRRVRADQPVERAVHDRHLEDRALPGFRQHRGAEDERAVAAVDLALGRTRPPRPACRRACSTSCTASARTPASRCVPTPTCVRSRSPGPRPPATASCSPPG